MKKRVGYFFMGFIPFLMVYVLQMAAIALAISSGLLASGIWSSNNLYQVFMELYSDTDFNMALMLVYALAAICMFGLWYYMRLDGSFRLIPGKTIRPMPLLSLAILVPGLQCMADFITTGLYYAAPAWVEAYEELMEAAGLSDDLTFMTVLYGILIGPIAEELIFRGCTIKLFERVIRHFWIVNLLQAVLFGIFHGNWVQGCYACALGLVLGYVCERGGSIYYSMFLHILFNLWGLVVTELLTPLLNSSWGDFILILAFFISLGAGGYLFIRETQKCQYI